MDRALVNLLDRVLEVDREPVLDVSGPYGWRYRAVTTLTPPASVAPLALPALRLNVAALLA